MFSFPSFFYIFQANLKSKRGVTVHPLPRKATWVACSGSEPHYRGYPCSLWTLFHTLTVNCNSRHEVSGLEVLSRIREYIRYFFSCVECKEHFTAMSANLKNEVSSHNEAILWLWRGHNKVNKRLAGDRSEDPKHPKIQFPSIDLCEECRLPQSNNGDEVHWNEGVVLEFLKNHYGVDNIRIKKPSATSSPGLDDADIVSKQTKRHFVTHLTMIGLNSLDASMCLILYSAIALAVIALYVYFIRRRRRTVKLRVHTPWQLVAILPTMNLQLVLKVLKRSFPAKLLTWQVFIYLYAGIRQNFSSTLNLRSCHGY